MIISNRNKRTMQKLNRFLKQYRMKKFFLEKEPGQINRILNRGGNSVLSVLNIILEKNGMESFNERYQYVLKYYKCFFKHKYGSKQFKEEFFTKIDFKSNFY